MQLTEKNKDINLCTFVKRRQKQVDKNLFTGINNTAIQRPYRKFKRPKSRLREIQIAS